MNSMPKLWHTLPGVCALLMVVTFSSRASELGEIEVFSSVGEHLQASIEITNLLESDKGKLKVELADEALLKAAGIKQSATTPFLYSEVNTDEVTGRPIVKLMSSKPVTESSVHLLVDLIAPSGSYLGEYVVKLNPQTLTLSASGSATVANTNTSPAVTQVTTVGAAKTVKVRPGDSLMEIARSHSLQGASIEQTTWAIYKANPRAFSGSVHRLIAGSTLRIPGLATRQSISQQTAQAELKKGLPKEQPALAQPGDSQIAATIIEPESASTTNADSGSATVQVGLIGARDPSIPIYQSEYVEVPAVYSETTDSGLKVTTVTSSGAANIAPPVTTPDISTAANSAATDDATKEALSEVKTLILDVSGSVDDVRGSVNDVRGSVNDLNSSVEQNSRQLSQLGDQVEELQTVAEVPVVVETLVPATPVSLEKSENGSWMSNQYLRSIALIGLALLLSLGLLASQLMKKRRETETPGVKAGPEAQGATKQQKDGVKARTRDVAMATASSGISSAPSAINWFRQHLTSGRVSEEDLIKALKQYPLRQDLRLRLMERYANRKEIEAFARLGREMFQVTRGHNEEWPKVIQMGLALEMEMAELEHNTKSMPSSLDYGLSRDIDMVRDTAPAPGRVSERSQKSRDRRRQIEPQADDSADLSRFLESTLAPGNDELDATALLPRRKSTRTKR